MKLLTLVCLFLLGSHPLHGGEKPLSQFDHMTYEDRESINELISTLGSQHVAKLLFKRKHMNSLGDSVRHVPPLEFLGFIFSQPHLRAHMNEVKSSYFKWTNFIDGLTENMEKELSSGRLMYELEEFSLLVDRDLRRLEAAARSRAWHKFVKILL